MKMMSWISLSQHNRTGWEHPEALRLLSHTQKRQFQDNTILLDERQPIRGNTNAEKEILISDLTESCFLSAARFRYFTFTHRLTQFPNNLHFPIIFHIRGTHCSWDGKFLHYTSEKYSFGNTTTVNKRQQTFAMSSCLW